MSNYKEMYLKLIRASEEAISILIRAQLECEEIYTACESADGNAGSEL